MDEINVAIAIKAIVDGEIKFMQDCLQFYTGKCLEKHKRATWLPWKYPGHVVYDSFIPNISDKKLRELS